MLCDRAVLLKCATRRPFGLCIALLAIQCLIEDIEWCMDHMKGSWSHKTVHFVNFYSTSHIKMLGT